MSEEKDLNVEKKKRFSKFKAKCKSLALDFKKFVSRGNVLDMAVGVVIGGAFSAIVKATTNILLSLATWAVPGGLNGLVTVLPALNPQQSGHQFAGQHFLLSDLDQVVTNFAASKGVEVAKGSQEFFNYQAQLLKQYTLHGDIYTYNMSAVIDWGTVINAIISFIIIALTLFVIVKVAATVGKKREEFKKAALEQYYDKHPEERPAPPVPGKPEPKEIDVLVEIRDTLKAKEAPKTE